LEVTKFESLRDLYSIFVTSNFGPDSNFPRQILVNAGRRSGHLEVSPRRHMETEYGSQFLWFQRHGEGYVIVTPQR
jgi:hypothetical protein